MSQHPRRDAMSRSLPAKKLWSLPRALYIAAASVAAIAGCDPVDRITMTVPAPAGDTVFVYWVQSNQGRTSWDAIAGRGTATGAGLVITSQPCCGTASAYRAGRLGFFACAEGPGRPPTLICGKAGSSARLTYKSRPDQTCDTIERSLARMNLDLATCELTAWDADDAR